MRVQMEVFNISALVVQVFLYLLLLRNGTSAGKADEMCKKYGEYVYTDEASPVMLPGVKTDKQSQCGIVEVPLIVGGEKTGAKEFPHMAAIGYGGDSPAAADYQCGGTVISERYVLTAAHCLKSQQLGPAKWVRTGDINLEGSNDDANPQTFQVEKTIPHPDYKAPSTYNDIMLLYLNKDIQFDGYTRPACLNTRPDLWTKTAIAIGFGKIGYDTEERSKNLLKVQLSFVETATCDETFKFDKLKVPSGVAQGQLCAGVQEGGKDTCQGDSGGPLQTVLEDPYCMYTIVGVTSFGKFCGFANAPAVYTRVSAYVPWIESIVWA